MAARAPKGSPHERHAVRAEKVAEASRLLEAGVREVIGAEGFRRYLRFSARFHRYSANNALLILAQRPDATRVAGYGAWRSMGRQVRRGEKGIRILAPVTRKAEDERGEEEPPRAVVGFRTATVFDVSQTDGEELPEAPTPEDLGAADPSGVAARLYVALRRVCEAEGVAVEAEDLALGEYGGYQRGAKRITLNRSLSEVDRATTLAHELAHHLLHAQGGGGKAARETEAEGVSYALFSCFGLDTARFSFAYVARYAREPEILKAALERIRRTTHRLIEAVERTEEDDVPG